MVFIRKFAVITASFVAGGLLSDHLKKSWRNSTLPSHVEAAAPSDISRPNEIMRFGFPSNSNVRVKQNYVIGYDNRLRNASWVFEHIDKDLVKTNMSDRTKCDFVEDTTIHRFFRGTNKDFYRSGFDRGHLAAAANSKASQEWTEDTFNLSNVVPQHPFMNQHAWNNLERFVRSLAFHYDNIYVCTGPLYLPKMERDGKLYTRYQVIGENHVAVPTHLFKVVVCERKSQLELLSYVMPNEWVDPNIPLDKFLYPIQAIERASGLIMFDRIPRENFRKINRGLETML